MAINIFKKSLNTLNNLINFYIISLIFYIFASFKHLTIFKIVEYLNAGYIGKENIRLDNFSATGKSPFLYLRNE